MREPDVGRRPLRRQVSRAEDHVPHQQHLREVVVRPRDVLHVMPPVQLRPAEDPVERTQPHVDVAVLSRPCRLAAATTTAITRGGAPTSASGPMCPINWSPASTGWNRTTLNQYNRCTL